MSVAVAAGARHLPPADGRWGFEPKLDGWRALGFADTRTLHSRRGTLLATRFPEVAAAVTKLGTGVVVDGELVALRGDRLEFAALQGGPSARAQAGVTVHLVVFDLLAIDHRDLRRQPYEQRRAALEQLIPRPRPHLQLVEMTSSRETALEWMDPDWTTAGIEGVMAKPLNSRYFPGTRSGWLKIRQHLTTEAVVLGVSGADALVLGQPSPTGWHVSGVSQPLTAALRTILASELTPDPDRPEPVQLPGSSAGLPGSGSINYLPVLPTVVVEIEADTAIEYGRWRHRPRVLRIRPDLRPDEL